MELEVRLQSLQQAEEQLDSCRRITRSCVEELAEVLKVLEREMADDPGYELRIRMKGYQEKLIDSHDRLQALCLGLAQAGRLYEECEEELTQSAEALVKRYAERTGVQNIEKYRFIRISGL